MSDFVIDTLHNRKHQPVYAVYTYLNGSDTVTTPLFPCKVFKTYEEARTAAMDNGYWKTSSTSHCKDFQR